jgi:hypothetical protein
MATGIPHGTTAGADGPRGPDDTAGLPPARPGSGWTAGRVNLGPGLAADRAHHRRQAPCHPAGPVRLTAGAR